MDIPHVSDSVRCAYARILLYNARVLCVIQKSNWIRHKRNKQKSDKTVFISLLRP